MFLAKLKQQKNKIKINKAVYIFSGFIILINAFDKFDTGQNTYVYYLLAGLLFLIAALFYDRLVLKYPLTDTLFLAIGAFISFIIAFEFFQIGKTGLPMAYLLAGLIQMFAIYVFTKKTNKNKKKTA